jgi:hypothetical protein
MSYKHFLTNPHAYAVFTFTYLAVVVLGPAASKIKELLLLQGSELLAAHAASSDWVLLCPASNPGVMNAGCKLLISDLSSVTDCVIRFTKSSRIDRRFITLPFSLGDDMLVKCNP